VQACILCPFTGRLDLEAARDVGEDLTQLEQRKRRPEAAPLAASEGHPRARVGPLRQESVGSEGVGLRVPMAMDQRGRDLRPGHFVQSLEPVELIELSPVEEHDRTMATIARNAGLVAS
jgi:hypothetical protein